MSARTTIIFTVATAIFLLVGCGAPTANTTRQTVVVNAHAKPKNKSKGNHTLKTDPSMAHTNLQLNPNSLYMISKSTGWDFSRLQATPTLNGVVLRTDDGGKTWHNCTPTSVSAQETFAGGLAVSDSEAWLFVSAGKKTLLYHTTDGGASWTSTSIPKSYLIADLRFSDAQHGWLLASQGSAAGQEPIDLYYTSDGGKTWSQILSKTESNKLLLGNRTGVTFINRTTGWITVDSGQHPGQVEVYVTHDGGHSWALQTIPVSTILQKHYAYPLAPIFTSSQVGIMPVTFDDGTTVIYTTENGGQDWNSTKPVPVSNVVNVSYDGQTVYVTDGKSVYDSRDNGQSWVKWKGTIGASDQIGDVTAQGVYVVKKGGSEVVDIPF